MLSYLYFFKLQASPTNPTYQFNYQFLPSNFWQPYKVNQHKGMHDRKDLCRVLPFVLQFLPFTCLQIKPFTKPNHQSTIQLLPSNNQQLTPTFAIHVCTSAAEHPFYRFINFHHPSTSSSKHELVWVCAGVSLCLGHFVLVLFSLCNLLQVPPKHFIHLSSSGTCKIMSGILQ